jgi:hypothetical protein
MVDDQWLGAEPAGYRIDALIGCGGAGLVYPSHTPTAKRPAADTVQLVIDSAGAVRDVDVDVQVPDVTVGDLQAPRGPAQARPKALHVSRCCLSEPPRV